MNPKFLVLAVCLQVKLNVKSHIILLAFLEHVKYSVIHDLYFKKNVVFNESAQFVNL